MHKVNQKYTFTRKLTTKCNFQTLSLFFSSTVTEWNAQDCGIPKAAKDTSMLPSKIAQMKVSHETGSEANFGLGRALMPSYCGMCPPKAAFFSFRMQPRCAVCVSCLSVLPFGSLLKTVVWDYPSSPCSSLPHSRHCWQGWAIPVLKHFLGKIKVCLIRDKAKFSRAVSLQDQNWLSLVQQLLWS